MRQKYFINAIVVYVINDWKTDNYSMFNKLVLDIELSSLGLAVSQLLTRFTIKWNALEKSLLKPLEK